MKIKLLRNTVADGRTVGIGQIIDVTDGTGKALVQMGKAIEVIQPIPESPAPADDEPRIEVEPLPALIETGEEPIEMSAPPPTRRTKGKGSK